MSKFPNFLKPAAGGAAGLLACAYVATDQFVTDLPSLTPHLVGFAAAATDGEAAPAATGDENAADASSAAAAEQPDRGSAEGGATFGLGRAALPEEIAAWNLEITPDGTGLPEGRGDVFTGEELFVENCASCHGDFAEGVGNWPALAGGFDTLSARDPVKTVGSYWPYLSTVWDYVHRSMPYGSAQTLSNDDVYAIVAYILYSNFLVQDDFELSHENFSEITMPNADGFIVDDRPETEYPDWRQEPCMSGCKDRVEITMRATVLDVTPEDDTDQANLDEGQNVAQPAPSEDAQPAQTGEDAQKVAAVDPALVDAGEKVFRKCKACHQIGEDASNRVGPHLNNVFGRTIGGLDGFRYSSAFQEMASQGKVWDEAGMAEFLAKPRDYISGTKMSFAGLRNEDDIKAVSAYLKAESAE